MKTDAPKQFPFDVFLSHSSKDKPLVRVLAKQFRDEEGLRCWYDEWNLQPGLPWQEALEQGLADSASIVVFIGPEKLGPWHNEELREAINRSVGFNDGFRVIPALLPGADPEGLPTFLKRMMWVDFRGGIDDELAFKKLTAAIRGEAVEESAFTLPETLKPYMGMAPYGAESQQFFFGRKEESGKVADLLQHQRGVLLMGDSGVGKTSLIQAGVVPRLKDSAGTRAWQVLCMEPGSDPLKNLALMVLGLEENGEAPLQMIDQANALVQQFEASDSALRDALAILFDAREQSLLIVLDQLEELFVHCKAAFPEKYPFVLERFAANLADTMRLGDGKVRFLLSLRSDFECALGELPGFERLFPEGSRYILPEMSEENLRVFVQQTAFTAGAFYEKGLVNTLLKEVDGQACKLTMLQMQLSALWGERKGAWLTVDAHERNGGIGEMVQELGNVFLQKHAPQGISGALRMVLMRLIEPGEGAADRRFAAPQSCWLAPLLQEQGVVRLLSELSGPEFRLVEASGGQLVLAHDSLVREWPPIRHFLDSHRGQIRALHRLANLATDWEDHGAGGGKEFLMKGVLLEEVEELERKGAEQGVVMGQLSTREAQFIKASQHDRKLKKQRQRAFTISISVALIVALVFLVVAIQAQQEAKANLKVAEENYARFQQEQADKVRSSVEEVMDRVQALKSIDSIYEDQRLFLLKEAREELYLYRNNSRLREIGLEIQSMIQEIEAQ